MSTLLPLHFDFSREQEVHDRTFARCREAMEQMRQQMHTSFENILRIKDADIARLTEESSRRLREQRDLRDIIRDNARTMSELRYALQEYIRRFGNIELGGDGGATQTLQRIETLINNNLVNQESPFRTSLIKYTSPAFWIFSLYDALVRYSSIAYQSIKTHLVGVRVLVFG